MMDVISYEVSSTFYGPTYFDSSCSSGTKRQETINSPNYKNQQYPSELTDIDQTTVFAFKTLIKRYKKQMGDLENISIVTGGLQQYLNKKALTKPTEENECHQPDSIFHKLPMDCKLHIFSFLEAKDLCRICGVCRDWYFVCEDNILWRDLLERDTKSWNVIGHNTNPSLYKEVQSDWSNKEIYLRCSPEIYKMMHKDAVFSFTNFFKSLLPRKSWTPKIAMFGPGLESELTSGLVRKILYENNNHMVRTGLQAGQEGVGSLWGYKLPNGQTFQLSVLYSASKQQRTQKSWNRMTGNNLIQVGKDEEGEDTVELKPAVRDFCKTVDAFVYVVDATSMENLRASENYELSAMLKERWLDTHIPVLVMSCVANNDSSRVPNIDVVDSLHMGKLNRPWQVRSCWINENLEGVVDGISWLIEQAQRR